MKQGLREINELVEVWGSLICNNEGEIIDSAPPPGFDKSNLENVSHHCVDLLLTGNEYVEGMGEMVIYFQQHRLLVLDLNKAILIVFCTPNIDISLLRMTINLVTTRWDDDKKIQKQLEDNFVERV